MSLKRDLGKGFKCCEKLCRWWNQFVTRISVNILFCMWIFVKMCSWIFFLEITFNMGSILLLIFNFPGASYFKNTKFPEHRKGASPFSTHRFVDIQPYPKVYIEIYKSTICQPEASWHIDTAILPCCVDAPCNYCCVFWEFSDHPQVCPE